MSLYLTFWIPWKLTGLGGVKGFRSGVRTDKFGTTFNYFTFILPPMATLSLDKPQLWVWVVSDGVESFCLAAEFPWSVSVRYGCETVARVKTSLLSRYSSTFKEDTISVDPPRARLVSVFTVPTTIRRGRTVESFDQVATTETGGRLSRCLVVGRRRSQSSWEMRYSRGV